MGISKRTENGHPYELFSEKDEVFDVPQKPWVNSALRTRTPRARTKRTWGWDCQRCESERSGFRTMFEAQTDCEEFHKPAVES